MSQRSKIVGVRAPVIWLLTVIVPIVIVVLEVHWFVALSRWNITQHYQSSVTFQAAAEHDLVHRRS